MREIASIALAAVGGLFFIAGTVGILRFPDTCSRLHAVTKADNLGLGFTVASLTLRAESWFAAAELIVVWLLALVASATSGYLLTSSARTDGGDAS